MPGLSSRKQWAGPVHWRQQQSSSRQCETIDKDYSPQQLKTKETVGGRPPTKKKTTPFLPAGALHSRSNADGEAAALLPRSLFRERVALFHSRPLG